VIIEVGDLEDEPLHVNHTYPQGALPFRHEDAVLEEPVAVDFTLTHAARDLRLGGFLETAVRFTCARCLKQVPRRLATSFDLLYLPQPAGTAGPEEEIELKYDEMEVGFYDGQRLDVDLMVLEQIELSIPMRFVCREDCRGLCYRCGADLTEKACTCTADSGDSRLAVLREFRKKMDQ
jgi:uncharacterized protein